MRHPSATAVTILALPRPGRLRWGRGGGSTTSTAATTAPQKPSSPSTAQSQGSGSNSSGEQSGSTAKSKSASAAHHNSGGQVAAFRTPGGDNSIQDFGAEAATSQRDRAAAALHAYLDARAGQDSAKACSYLAAGTRRQIKQLGLSSHQLAGRGCAAVLTAFSAAAPPSARAAAAVASLRLQGTRAFILLPRRPQDRLRDADDSRGRRLEGRRRHTHTAGLRT